jgi:tRNA(Ile)-lysidine synthetase-like protein
MLVATTQDSVANDPQLGLDGLWRPPRVTVPERLVPPGGAAGLAHVALGGLDRPFALEARSRRPGDRIVTAAGTRKLQDVMVDAGVPRAVRALLPVVTSGRRVLWVPGLAVDERARLDGSGTPQVHLMVADPAYGRRAPRQRPAS